MLCSAAGCVNQLIARSRLSQPAPETTSRKRRRQRFWLTSTASKHIRLAPRRQLDTGAIPPHKTPPVGSHPCVEVLSDFGIAHQRISSSPCQTAQSTVRARGRRSRPAVAPARSRARSRPELPPTRSQDRDRLGVRSNALVQKRAR